MKTIFTSLLVCVTVAVYAVACSGISVSLGQLTYYNWSQSSYDVSDHYITVGTTEYAVNSLNIEYGSLSVAPGDSVKFSGFSFKTAQVNPNSVALWAPGTFPGTPVAGDMVDFVQYGDTGQPYEDLAIQAFLWTAGDYIDGEPDYVRNSFNFTGSNEWTALDNVSTGITNIFSSLDVVIQPNPFNSRVTVQLGSGSGNIAQCQLLDYSGRVVNSVDVVRESEIQLEADAGLPPGIYLVRVIANDGSAITRKVLKL